MFHATMAFILQTPVSQHLGSSCPFPKNEKLLKSLKSVTFSDEIKEYCDEKFKYLIFLLQVVGNPDFPM